MKQSLVIFLAVVAVASAAHYPEEFGQKLIAHLFDLANQQHEAYENNYVEPEPLDVAESNFQERETQGLILNIIGKKVIKGILRQMPCGWPSLGIPSLAPFYKEEININLNKSVLKTSTQLENFRIDGLNNMQINKLRIGFFFTKKMKYNFTFPRITISGKYLSDTIIDLMKEYGISVQYDGDGEFEFVLENLNIAGEFKYKLPFFRGSIKLYNFKTVVTLGNFVSNIKGLMGNGRASNFMNDEIQDVVLWAINDHKQLISSNIEQIIVPNFNKLMEGRNLISILTHHKRSRKGSKCQ